MTSCCDVIGDVIDDGMGHNMVIYIYCLWRHNMVIYILSLMHCKLFLLLTVQSHCMIFKNITPIRLSKVRRQINKRVDTRYIVQIGTKLSTCCTEVLMLHDYFENNRQPDTVLWQFLCCFKTFFVFVLFYCYIFFQTLFSLLVYS